jgi:1-acyl-sn-glycerol-3-phosphate acyltransferase
MRRIPVLYHKVLCWIVGVKISVTGELSNRRPLLVVSNHISWLDICVISSVAPVSFIAKREVATWPLFGLLAKWQRSIFVDRERRLKSGAVNQEIAKRMLADDAMILFAEGTSSDGRGVLPFRSALIGAATAALTKSDAGEVYLQPLSLSYLGESADAAPWYGDMDLVPHLLEVLRLGKMEVAISWGEPLVFNRASDRKETARKLEQAVRALKREVEESALEGASQAA